MNNIIIVGIILLAIIITISIICYTIYKIKFISHPEVPKRLLWINSDMMDVKHDIRKIKEKLEIK